MKKIHLNVEPNCKVPIGPARCFIQVPGSDAWIDVGMITSGEFARKSADGTFLEYCGISTEDYGAK